jgi:hypothetical protein
MKRPKNTPLKPEPPKPEPVRIVTPRPESPKVVAVRSEEPRITAAKTEVPAPVIKTQPPPIGRVSFEFVKPGAKSVFVAGSFNDWKPEKAPLAPAGNGRWTGDVALKPGRHEYLFVVDGQWIPDPNAKESVQNPFGGRNSILGVSE